MPFIQVITALNGIKFLKEPTNITVVEHDNVYVPCCTNTSFLPSWRINDNEYSSTVGLPSHFFLNATHLIIPNIALSLSGTAVQCFFLHIVPNVGLVKVNSSLGIITVTSKATITANTSVITATNTLITDNITSPTSFSTLGKAKQMSQLYVSDFIIFPPYIVVDLHILNQLLETFYLKLKTIPQLWQFCCHKQLLIYSG